MWLLGELVRVNVRVGVGEGLGSGSELELELELTWKPPTVLSMLPSMPYMLLSSASYRLAPPPLTYGVRALSMRGTTLARVRGRG